jgi:hypothetical protein
LGLANCEMTGGEKQYQIPSGTPITDLHRNMNRGGWEKYDSSKKAWNKVTTSAFLQNCQ